MWAFVAVKLNASEKRHYENEYLPPLTIKYQYDRLISPLRISSISTTRTAKITLYVIADSTVTSSNLSIATLKYEERLSEMVDPELYIKACPGNNRRRGWQGTARDVEWGVRWIGLSP